MRELIPQVWDDLDLAEGRHTPAGPGAPVVLRLGVTTVELDLTAAHKAELAELLDPWLKAGSRSTRGGARYRSPGQTGLSAARVYNREMAAWADAHGYHYSTGKNGKHYFGKRVREAYAAHLEATGRRS